MIEIKLEDIIKFKKPHPCGSFEWKVKRVGIDLKLECLGCGRQIMISRVDAIKRIKK